MNTQAEKDRAAWRELRRFLANFKKPADLNHDVEELRAVLAEKHAPPETIAVLLGIQCNTEGDVERYARLVRAGHCFFSKMPPRELCTACGRRQHEAGLYGCPGVTR